MVEKCGFCSHNLTSIPELIDHYANSHNTTKDNSPVFESCVDLLTKPSSECLMEECEYCGKTFFDGKLKTKHFLRKHLKMNGNSNNILIRRIDLLSLVLTTVASKMFTIILILIKSLVVL